MNTLSLSQVDRLEVAVLADNYTDMFLIQDNPVCLRPKIMPPKAFLAEHGFCCLIKVSMGTDEQIILFDGSVSSGCVIHNADLLKIRLSSVDAVVLSHGHPDHFLGLPGILQKTARKMPLYIHPDVLLTRRLNNPSTGPMTLPVFPIEELITAGAIPDNSRMPRTIAETRILLTGEIERTTSYEVGFPGAEVLVNGSWQVDPFRDEQAMVINVRDKGLVIISGCAHAGIINTIRYAQKITGISKVHAVMGGFHMTGPLFEPVIQPTMDDLNCINPDYVIPMHCTGWNTITKFTSSMPEKVILNTVGTRYCFQT